MITCIDKASKLYYRKIGGSTRVVHKSISTAVKAICNAFFPKRSDFYSTFLFHNFLSCAQNSDQTFYLQFYK